VSRLTIILFSKNLLNIVTNIFINLIFQPKKDVSAAPIMHPIFGASDPNQVPPSNNMMNPGMPGQNQYDQSYGTAAQSPSQMQSTAPMSIMNPTNFYQPQQQQQQMQDNSNMINYQNFNSFVGAPQQQQQKQEMPVQPAIQEVVNEKSPLPEEFIYLQTVLEELKTQCINRATNPVRLIEIFMNGHCMYNFVLAANEA